MSDNIVLKALACDVNVTDLAVAIKSAMSKKEDCEIQLIRAAMSYCFNKKLFHFLLEKIDEIATKDFELSSKYLATLLHFAKSHAEHDIVCLNYLAKNEGREIEIDFEILKDVEDLSNDDKLTRDISALIHTMDESSADDTMMLKMSLAIKSDLFRIPVVKYIKDKMLDSYASDSEFIDLCFKFILKHGSLSNEILSTCFYYISKKSAEDDEDYEEDELVKEFKKIKFVAKPDISGSGWSPPSTLMRVNGTFIYYTKDLEKDFASKIKEQNSKKVWKEMIQDSEQCVKDLSKTKTNEGKTKTRSSKEDYTLTTQQIWEAMSGVQKEEMKFGSVLRLEQYFKDKTLDVCDSNPDWMNAIIKELKDKIVKKTKVTTSSPSKVVSSKAIKAIDNIPEISRDNIRIDLHPPKEFIQSSTTTAFANVAIDGENYVGKVISQYNNDSYNRFFNKIKAMFGLEQEVGVAYKVKGKLVLKSIKKGSKDKVLEWEDEEIKEDKREYSVLFCYKTGDRPYYKLDEGHLTQFDDLCKNVVKLAIVRWLFGFSNTNYDNVNVYKEQGKNVYNCASFWECNPSFLTNEKCIKGLLKSQDSFNKIEEVYEEVVQEVSNIIEKNVSEIFKMIPGDKDKIASNKTILYLRSKIYPAPENKSDSRTTKELISEFIKNELNESKSSMESSKKKKSKN